MAIYYEHLVVDDWMITYRSNSCLWSSPAVFSDVGANNNTPPEWKFHVALTINFHPSENVELEFRKIL